MLVDLASEKAASIHRLADLQEIVSAARIEAARDEIGVIHQITAALKELRSHFRRTMADNSIEIAQHRVGDSLQKARAGLELVAAFLAP